jgi:RNA polymerase sigma factor (TIGR02999 family)
MTIHSQSGEITLLLSNIEKPESLHMLMEAAYPELRRKARWYSLKQPPGSTWHQPTALANETCLRLLSSGLKPQNRGHFYSAAATTMRRITMDGFRRHKARKRGGGWRRVDFDEAERVGFQEPSDLLAFDDALGRLSRVNPTLSHTVELLVWAGCTLKEAAIILSVSVATVRKRWAAARKWLKSDLASCGMADARH